VASRKRVANTAPGPRPVAGGSAADRALFVLRDNFDMRALTSLPDFLLVVEGETDRGYLQRAADQLRDETGEDMLEVPGGLRQGPHSRIVISVAKEPGNPLSGGTERMVDLARDILGEVFTHEVLRVMFLFDHDYAGRKAADQIAKYGYRRGIHSLTHDPALHPNACVAPEDGDPPVVIEDLLPLSLQQRFFDQGGASCDVIYRSGVVKRYKWVPPSKGQLKRFVVGNASSVDLAPLRAVLALVRQAFGFPPSEQKPIPLSGSSKLSQEAS